MESVDSQDYRGAKLFSGIAQRFIANVLDRPETSVSLCNPLCTSNLAGQFVHACYKLQSRWMPVSSLSKRQVLKSRQAFPEILRIDSWMVDKQATLEQLSRCQMNICQKEPLFMGNTFRIQNPNSWKRGRHSLMWTRIVSNCSLLCIVQEVCSMVDLF